MRGSSSAREEPQRPARAALGRGAAGERDDVRVLLGVPPLARAVAERSGEALLDTTLADAVHGGDPDVEDRGWGRF